MRTSQGYTVSHLMAMCRTIVVLRNSYVNDQDQRYIRFITALSARTGKSSKECLQRIRAMAEGDASGFIRDS